MLQHTVLGASSSLHGTIRAAAPARRASTHGALSRSFPRTDVVASYAGFRRMPDVGQRQAFAAVGRSASGALYAADAGIAASPSCLTIPADRVGVSFLCCTGGRRERSLVVRTTALFEKFTEGAIKAVMMGQEEAKAMAAGEVCSEHILLGLASQDNGKAGYMESGITLPAARAAVQEMFGKSKARDPSDVTKQDIPFSQNAKRVFEQASTVRAGPHRATPHPSSNPTPIEQPPSLSARAPPYCLHNYPAVCTRP